VEGSVLVLNASYEPINICNLRRAMKMIIKGVARAEETSDRQIRSVATAIQVPLVIRLVRYVRIPHIMVKFSRRNVFMRDQYACQYTGEEYPKHLLTIDHVIPRSRGGMTTWDNVVSACRKCNIKKGNRTPSEANMMLIRKPKSPTIITYMHMSYQFRHDPSWKKYLYLN